MKKQFEIPILLIIFNKLETTKIVFKEIKKIKPKKLFISCDGPRTRKEEEKQKQMLKYIIKNIDWNCEIKTNIIKNNLGCGKAVPKGIDWFFQNVEMGIILEDDCLPNQTFFEYCKKLLIKYKDNNKISMISGQNIVHNYKIKDSFTFSKYSFIWGWATWKKSWERFNNSKINYKSIKEDLEEVFSKIEIVRIKKQLKNVNSGKVDSWAFKWNFFNLKRRTLCIVPKRNLVKNIGFSNKVSTNTKDNYFDKMFLCKKRENIKFPLNYPNRVTANDDFDRMFFIEDIIRAILKKLNPIRK